MEYMKKYRLLTYAEIGTITAGAGIVAGSIITLDATGQNWEQNSMWALAGVLLMNSWMLFENYLKPSVLGKAISVYNY